jgi:membrane fusion protein (multidrug efflux system)
MQPPPQVVVAAQVNAKLWTPGIDAIGTARAENGVQLAVETSGIVKDILIKPNQHFAKGEVLVQLDDSVERADLLDIQAAVKLSQANLERSTTLRSRGYDTQASFDQLEAQLATARSRMARIQAVIDQKAVKAPFSGVAGISRINPGQYLTPGTVVTTFQDLRSMKVDFTVPEQVAPQVKVGQPVRFGMTETDLPYKGSVVGLDPRVDPKTRLVTVQAILADNSNETVLPGQFMHVRIDLEPQPNVITVPQTAVVTSLYGDYVYTVEREDRNGQVRDVARQVFVKVGRRRGAESEILSGLQPGQTVVVSGQNKLQAGSSVKIDNSIDLTKVATGE